MKQNKIFRFLASLKLAVVLLVALAVILAAATYYESLYDAKTAHHLVYGSPFFALFLFLLGVNVFCSAAIRYPFKAHQTGFVVTHAGIIILLAGSLVTMMWGVEGTMALQEGEKSDRITTDQPVLYFGSGRTTLREIDAEFRWNPPREGREYRYPLNDELTAVVDRYYHHSAEVVDYLPSPGAGNPALRLRLKSERVNMSQWLTFSTGRLSLGPAVVELSRLTEPQLKEFLAGELDRLDRGELQLLVADEPYRVQVRELGQQPTPLEGTDLSLVLHRYLPHAVVEEGELVSRSDEPVNPVVELELRRGESSQRWLLFGKLPELNTRIDSQGEELPVRLLYNFDVETEARGRLEFALSPEDELYYRLNTGGSGKVEVGREVPTGWMDIAFVVEAFLPEAQRDRTFREVELKKGTQEGPPPAIRVHVEGAPEPGPYWLQRGDIIQVPGHEGQNLVLGYGLRTVPAGFELTLKDFEVGYDPGTKTAASYKSLVEVAGQEHLIQMNEPLQHGGFTLYQASFAEVEGEPVISVLSVARDPGITIKYVGSVMLVLGIIIMFYLKPYLAKKNQQPKAVGASAVASPDEEEGAL